MTAEITTLHRLVDFARIWGSVEEWQGCFDCPVFCSAFCFNLNEAWDAVVREQQRTKLRADGRWAVTT